MQAEIISGKLVILPSNPTELFALNMLKTTSPDQVVTVSTVNVDNSLWTESMYD